MSTEKAPQNPTKRDDERAEEASWESFPASDPPAVRTKRKAELKKEQEKQQSGEGG
ncbi:MAG: hypothetical protein JO110_00930 [Acetobacteraceae bacterium]|nr:hypothetical protein [Acetobacteraceae bacterium]